MCTSPSTQLSSLFAFSFHSKKIFVIACQDFNGMLTKFKTEQEAFVNHVNVVITTMKLLLTYGFQCDIYFLLTQMPNPPLMLSSEQVFKRSCKVTYRNN